MNRKQALKKYGKEMLKKMEKTGRHIGTIAILKKDGSFESTEGDYDRAYRVLEAENLGLDEENTSLRVQIQKLESIIKRELK